MKQTKNTLGPMARMWFAVTPQERALLFGILAVALIGLTARYLHLRASEPIPLEAPDGEPAYNVEEDTP